MLSVLKTYCGSNKAQWKTILCKTPHWQIQFRNSVVGCYRIIFNRRIIVFLFWYVESWQKYLAQKLFNTTDDIASSWLLCFTNIRNYCAHYSRLYYNKFGTIPATPKDYPYKLKDRIFDYILVLKFLYPDANKWNIHFLIGLDNLIKEYDEVIDLYHLGFPKNWKPY